MEVLAIIDNTALAQPVTIDEDLYNKFIAYLDASPKTIDTYKKALRRFFGYLSAKGISDPSREDIIAFKEQIKANCKPTTVQNYIVAIRLFFSWTEQEGLYKNIADKVKGARLNREHKKDYLTSKQIRNVLMGVDRNTIRGLRDYAILSLMVTGGLRTIEVSRENIEDIRVVGDSSVLYIQGKGKGKEKNISVNELIHQILHDYLS